LAGLSRNPLLLQGWGQEDKPKDCNLACNSQLPLVSPKLVEKPQMGC
jgi:hypothetical protein